MDLGSRRNYETLWRRIKNWIREERCSNRKSFRVAAKDNGMSLSEYHSYELGRDVCSYEKYEKSLEEVYESMKNKNFCNSLCEHDH